MEAKDSCYGQTVEVIDDSHGDDSDFFKVGAKGKIATICHDDEYVLVKFFSGEYKESGDSSWYVNLRDLKRI